MKQVVKKYKNFKNIKIKIKKYTKSKEYPLEDFFVIFFRKNFFSTAA